MERFSKLAVLKITEMLLKNTLILPNFYWNLLKFIEIYWNVTEMFSIFSWFAIQHGKSNLHVTCPPQKKRNHLWIENVNCWKANVALALRLCIENVLQWQIQYENDNHQHHQEMHIKLILNLKPHSPSQPQKHRL